jgi:hypothetical protein
LIFLTFLIAFPVVYIPWPPTDLQAACILFAICELFAAGVVFTFLALIWSIAAPAWIARLLESGSSRLVSITGSFLLNSGVGLIGAAIGYRTAVPFVVGIAALVMGPWLLRLNARKSSVNAESTPMKTY